MKAYLKARDMSDDALRRARRKLTKQTNETPSLYIYMFSNSLSKKERYEKKNDGTAACMLVVRSDLGCFFLPSYANETLLF